MRNPTFKRPTEPLFSSTSRTSTISLHLPQLHLRQSGSRPMEGRGMLRRNFSPFGLSAALNSIGISQRDQGWSLRPNQDDSKERRICSTQQQTLVYYRFEKFSHRENYSVRFFCRPRPKKMGARKRRHWAHISAATSGYSRCWNLSDFSKTLRSHAQPRHATGVLNTSRQHACGCRCMGRRQRHE